MGLKRFQFLLTVSISIMSLVNLREISLPHVGNVRGIIFVFLSQRLLSWERLVFSALQYFYIPW